MKTAGTIVAAAMLLTTASMQAQVTYMGTNNFILNMLTDGAWIWGELRRYHLLQPARKHHEDCGSEERPLLSENKFPSRHLDV